MKPVISILLLLSILLAIAGCGKPQESTVNTGNVQVQPGTTEASIEPTVLDVDAPLHIPMISVSMPVVLESESADDGTEIFRYVYQNMSLILPEPEIADKIIVDFLNRMDKTSNDAESIKAAAKADYNSENWSPYLCQITYNPIRIDSGVLSLFGNYTRYSGAPHPESTDISVNYNLVTGAVIELDNIFTSDATDTLIDEIIQALNVQKVEKSLFDGFENTVINRFKDDLAHEKNWYFSSTGLCFYFTAYDIAPYASGVIVAEVPYEKLAGLMDDAYFPAEPETVGGTLNAELFTVDQLDNYDVFSEVTVDKGAVKTLLHTDSSVYDVRIETGSWSANGEIFIPEHTVYAAYALSADAAIMVESEIPDALPRLRITYQTGGRSVTRYLTDSGKDGSIFLIP